MNEHTKETHKAENKEPAETVHVKNLLQTLTTTVETNQQMLRACFMLLLLLLLAIGFLEYFRREWKDDFELHFPGVGAAIVLHSSADAGDFKSAVFLVPASQCWVNTGLEIKNGERITLRASGRIHLAMKQIEQEKIPKIPWSGPDGSPFIKLDSIDRSELLIHKHYTDPEHQLLIGNLVGYFLPVGEADNPTAKPSYNKPRPNAYGGIFHVGSRLENKLNDTGKTVNLWLSVNDVILENSNKAENAYMGEYDVFIRNGIKSFKLNDLEQTWKDKKREWRSIIDKQAWDLYYYDNIGHYLVTIEKQ